MSAARQRKTKNRGDWDLVDSFLPAPEADGLYQELMAEPWQRHAENCSAGLTDAFAIFYAHVIQPKVYGRSEVRAALPTMPEFLRRLLGSIEDHTEHTFNAIEAHRFKNTVRVYPHYDPHGVIAMITLGQERLFRVGGKIDFNRADKNYQTRQRHVVFEEKLLRHGSLLTFFGKVAHSMEPTDVIGDAFDVHTVDGTVHFVN